MATDASQQLILEGLNSITTPHPYSPFMYGDRDQGTLHQLDEKCMCGNAKACSSIGERLILYPYCCNIFMLKCVGVDNFNHNGQAAAPLRNQPNQTINCLVSLLFGKLFSQIVTFVIIDKLCNLDNDNGVVQHDTIVFSMDKGDRLPVTRLLLHGDDVVMRLGKLRINTGKVFIAEWSIGKNSTINLSY